MAPRADATETLCGACRRIAENCPAGELNLVGEFVTQHREEIRNLVRNIEQVENREHPVNRIMELRELDDRILVTTTDIHLPRRIGTALERAFKGKLDIHFDEGGYFTRVEWRRD